MTFYELFLIIWAAGAGLIALGGWERNTPIGRILMPLTWPYGVGLAIIGTILIAMLYVILLTLDALMWISIRGYQPKILKKKSGWKA